MSEYWKSTPKYWCKFCKIYVRDTTLERKSHEANPKHQHNIQRSLRELHKNTERDEREKQRAKDEVARLNGLVTGNPSAASSSSSAATASGPKLKSTGPAPASSGPASIAERKRQMEQLASMGVAVPEEFRRDLSLAGEWSTVSATPVYSRPVKHDSDSDSDSDHDSKAFGVRKRKVEDEDELDQARARARAPKAWGSTFKTYPGASGNSEEDLEALLSGSKVKKEVKKEVEDAVKEENEPQPIDQVPDVAETEVRAATAEVNKDQDAPVVFKKRKAKR